LRCARKTIPFFSLFFFLQLGIPIQDVIAEKRMEHPDSHRSLAKHKKAIRRSQHDHSDHYSKIKKPMDCDSLSEIHNIEIRVGINYAKNGLTYGYDKHLWRTEPCSVNRITLINEDNIRHQWMVHGLPRYLYHHGMFTLEVNGGQQISGVLTLPSDETTYFVHCDMSQHTEKGLKGQLVAGETRKTLPSIPGISSQRYPDIY